ncbi:MAG: retroviral-like aspartic protease family protein [Saprospiraceae bacterium]|jgi:clan AA aspartic protease (TIGR02281 family)|nr:retroviral-like aspartic protease family protein [Saprospiraceae bacterium]
MNLHIVLCTLCSVSLVAQDIFIPLKESYGNLKMPAEINGFEMEFIFDPGAYNVILSPEKASFLFKNGYLSKANIGGTTWSRIADGSIRKGTTITIDNIVIGGLILYDVTAIILDGKNTSNLFGLSALKKVARYSVNNITTMLEITPFPDADYAGECVVGNCETGQGKYVYFDGAYYEGAFLNGSFHGNGRFVWTDGDVFTCTYEQGVCSGKSEFIQNDGTITRGTYVNDLKEGIFTIHYLNGKEIKELYKNGELVCTEMQ